MKFLCLCVSNDERNVAEISRLDHCPRLFRKKGVRVEVVDVRLEGQRKEIDSREKQTFCLNGRCVDLESQMENTFNNF